MVFRGDNRTGRGVRSRMGDRVVVGGKGTTRARGRHVPLIVSGPGTVPRRTVCGDLVDSTDFFTTNCIGTGGSSIVAETG